MSDISRVEQLKTELEKLLSEWVSLYGEGAVSKAFRTAILLLNQEAGTPANTNDQR